MIGNGGKEIFFLCLLHYNHTYKVNQQFTGGGNMKYKHIVFDIDGTLIDTEYAVLHSLQETIKINRSSQYKYICFLKHFKDLSHIIF